MNQIQDVPASVTKAGLGFNYEVWTPGTELLLCNVPWNNDYRDIVDFENRAALDDYLRGLAGDKIHISASSYAKPNMPIRVNIPFNRAYGFNYLRVTNPVQPISGDTPGVFYYFITNVNYVAPNTTEIMVQLDVWQTFFTEVEFGRCYVERGHIGMVHEDVEDNNGRDFLTVPEGLDLGGEYLIRNSQTKPIGDGGDNNQHDASVIVVSTVDFSASGGTKDDPVLVSASGSESINGVPSGADVYYFENPLQFRGFLNIHRDRPWVTQGIIAAFLVPYIENSKVTGNVISGPSWTGKRVTKYLPRDSIVMLENWRDRLRAMLPARYQRLSKLLTYPYCFIELTMYNGKPLVIKPESLPGEDFILDQHTVITPPAPRVMLVPRGYNRGSGAGVWGQDEYLDFATGVSDFPQLAIVNNMYFSYMASNRNSIAFQHSQADWSQQKALGSAQTSYDQATGAIGTANTQRQISNSANTMQTGLANQTAGYRGLQHGASGLLNNLGAGNALGAVSSVANAAADVAISTNQNTQSTLIQNQANRAMTGAQTGQMGLVRDTNKDLADWAARGDYETTLAGINAKVQDARMIQPTVSGQLGGEAFVFSSMGGYKVRANFKFIDQNVTTMIGEFWLRYGYAVNRFHKIKSLSLMSNFTYWKVKELYLTAGRCPETFKQAIRGIFEKGVTVWRNPRNMATIDVGENYSMGEITL